MTHSQKYPLFLFTLLLTFVFVACNQTDSKTETNTEKVEVVDLNEDFVKKLEFPKTIEYLGLEKPKDTTFVELKTNVPNGMILVEGGIVQIGSDEGFEHERPKFWAKLKPFLMDENLVTVDDFRKFVKATGFKTEAEKFGNAGVIDETTGKEWILKDGANWEYPMGKDFPKAADNHPVTQVSWNDAVAYCKWIGKRLPSEIEWEHAARNARNSRSIYPWGDKIEEYGKWNANIWQGKFPVHNYVEDGFPQTSPVGKFGKTPIGLNDMSGNVWQWMSNWKFNYEALFRKQTYDSDLSTEKAERGGSFLCEPTWCHGYRVSGRSSSTPETSLFHVGFRCVKDI